MAGLVMLPYAPAAASQRALSRADRPHARPKHGCARGPHRAWSCCGRADRCTRGLRDHAERQHGSQAPGLKHSWQTCDDRWRLLWGWCKAVTELDQAC
eukprot:72636-Chlamydomonas_euryale.AAC.3